MIAPTIKSLVVDFDDTLSFTTNRDWANARPNTDLINKLNDLYDNGWNIHIVTARGQLSCNGDWIKADQKYRKQIEIWLYMHGVKYTDLSFQKKLGLYYIDDKGITPEDFLVKFRLKELKGGLSGASVVLDEYNRVIHKTADNTFDVVNWYKHASYLNYKVPKIHKVIGNTITMDYIESRPISTPEDYDRAVNIAKSFSIHKPIHIEDQNRNKKNYVHRCLTRVSDMFSDNSNNHRLNSIHNLIVADLVNIKSSFSHGDFSASNILVDDTDQSIYLIDPINDPTLFSSYENDIAKLQLSYLVNDLKFTGPIYRGLVVGHACRVLPYIDKSNTELVAKYTTLIDRMLDTNVI